MRVLLGRSLFLLLTMVLLGTLAAASAQKGNGSSNIAEGNVLYRDGEYGKAAEHFRKAIESGYDNGHVQYNLANAYYRLRDYGRAIAHYRLALKLLPGDPDATANLALARREAVDKIEEEDSAWSDLRRVLIIRSMMTEYQMRIVFAVLYSLFWLSFLLLPRAAVPGLKVFTNSLLALLLFWSLLTFGTRSDRVGKPTFAFTPSAHKIRPAVVIAEEAKVFSGNDESFQVVFVLHMGAEIEAAEHRDAWVELLLPNNRRGWIKKDHVEIL